MLLLLTYDLAIDLPFVGSVFNLKVHKEEILYKYLYAIFYNYWFIPHDPIKLNNYSR